MSGTLSQAFIAGAELLRVWFNQNSFSGTIGHANFGDRISHFSVSNNRLSGEIPSTLGKISDLAWLFISSNAGLSGTLPDLSHATKLDKIFGSNNKISGTLPSTMSSLTGLRYLELSDNRLSGSSTDGFKNWNLNLFSVFNNAGLDWDLGLLHEWERCIPRTVEDDWDTRRDEHCVSRFLLHSCAVTGVIPQRYRVTNLTTLLLSNNQVPPPKTDSLDMWCCITDKRNSSTIFV